MEKIEKTGLAALIAILSYAKGQIGILFWVYTILTWLDFLTGVIAAYINKELSSKACRDGALRKILTFFLIFGAILIEAVATEMGFDTHRAIYVATTCWYIATDFMSIIENAAEAGCKVPPGLAKVFKTIRKKTGLDDAKTDSETSVG